MIISIIYIITFINIAIYLYLIFLLAKKWRSGKAQRRFLLVILFSLLWVIDVVLENQTFWSIPIYKIISQFNYSLAILVAGFVSVFAIHFPKENKNFSTKKELLFFVPIIVTAILSFTELFVRVVSVREVQVNYVGYFVYLAIILIYFVIITGNTLVRKYKSTTGIPRQQLKYFVFGYSFSIAILIVQSVITNVKGLLPTHLDLLFTNASLIFSAFAVYAIVKFRFLDVKFALKKGAIRLLSFVIIFGVYLFAILSLKESINLSSSTSQTTFLIVATLIVVITIEPIRKLVHSIVDKAFESQDKKKEETRKRIYIALKSQQQYENLITSVQGILKDIYDVESIDFLASDSDFFKQKKETYHYFKNTGHILIPEELSYRLEEAEQYFHLHNELKDEPYSALMSIGQAELFIGCFVLGKRKNSKAYTVEEVREMKKLQDQFTEALLNARLYQQAIARIKI